jgi:hypothetical protein
VSAAAVVSGESGAAVVSAAGSAEDATGTVSPALSSSSPQALTHSRDATSVSPSTFDPRRSLRNVFIVLSPFPRDGCPRHHIVDDCAIM